MDNSFIIIEEEIDKVAKNIGEILAENNNSDVYVEDANKLRIELFEIQVKLRKFRKKW